MKITITEIEASTDDLMANRSIADALMDALSRVCDAIARSTVEAKEIDGDDEWEDE